MLEKIHSFRTFMSFPGFWKRCFMCLCVLGFFGLNSSFALMVAPPETTECPEIDLLGCSKQKIVDGCPTLECIECSDGWESLGNGECGEFFGLPNVELILDGEVCSADTECRSGVCRGTCISSDSGQDEILNIPAVLLEFSLENLGVVDQTDVVEDLVTTTEVKEDNEILLVIPAVLLEVTSNNLGLGVVAEAHVVDNEVQTVLDEEKQIEIDLAALGGFGFEAKEARVPVNILSTSCVASFRDSKQWHTPSSFEGNNRLKCELVSHSLFSQSGIQIQLNGIGNSAGGNNSNIICPIGSTGRHPTCVCPDKYDYDVDKNECVLPKTWQFQPSIYIDGKECATSQGKKYPEDQTHGSPCDGGQFSCKVSGNGVAFGGVWGETYMCRSEQVCPIGSTGNYPSCKCQTGYTFRNGKCQARGEWKTDFITYKKNSVNSKYSFFLIFRN